MFYRLRMALARFMQGRYGMDALNKFLFVAYFVLVVLNMIFVRTNRILYFIFYGIELVVMFLLFFRILSRNYYKRSMENNKYLSISNKFMAKFRLQKDKWNNRKTHVYRNCPNCKATIKLPRKKGKHVCTCPRCRVDFSVKV